MKRSIRGLLLCGSLALAGCSTNLGRYGHSRALDLMDSFPASVATGMGLLAQVRVTPLVGIGLGYANTTRYGTDDQRFGPVWTEKERGIPIVSYYRIQIYLDREDRWSGGNPLWWPEAYRARASSWIVLPGFPREGDVLVPIAAPLDPPDEDLWNFEPWLPITAAYHSPVHWHWPDYSWTNLLNVELGVVLGPVGARLGVSPIHLVDFIFGIFRFDFAMDDVRTFPVLWPDPDAPPSFPPEAETKSSAPVSPPPLTETEGEVEVEAAAEEPESVGP